MRISFYTDWPYHGGGRAGAEALRRGLAAVGGRRPVGADEGHVPDTCGLHAGGQQCSWLRSRSCSVSAAKLPVDLNREFESSYGCRLS